LSDDLEEKFSSCDNCMALQVKKVAEKREDRRFMAKNADFVSANFG
jgi:hypothetical protein